MVPSFLDIAATLGDATAWFLAGVLSLAAGHKVAAPARLVPATANLLGLNRQAARPLAYLAAASEAAAAAALLIPSTRAFGAILAAGVWSIYFAALCAAVLQGRRIEDCGCSLGQRHSGAGRQIGRLAFLIPLCGLAALSGGHLWPGTSPILAAAIFLLLLLSADELAATPARG